MFSISFRSCSKKHAALVRGVTVDVHYLQEVMFSMLGGRNACSTLFKRSRWLLQLFFSIVDSMHRRASMVCCTHLIESNSCETLCRALTDERNWSKETWKWRSCNTNCSCTYTAPLINSSAGIVGSFVHCWKFRHPRLFNDPDYLVMDFNCCSQVAYRGRLFLVMIRTLNVDSKGCLRKRRFV